MHKPRKLLFLLATAGAVTACAGSPARSARAPVATAVELRASVDAPAPAPEPVAEPMVANPSGFIVGDLVPALPLLNASGRPACGNVQTKKSGDSMKACD